MHSDSFPFNEYLKLPRAKEGDKAAQLVRDYHRKNMVRADHYITALNESSLGAFI